MSSKASHADWRHAVRAATGPSPAPTAIRPAEGTVDSKAVSEGRKEPLGTYIPESVALQVKEVSLKLSRERGTRVTISDIVTEALRDYLEKYLG